MNLAIVCPLGRDNAAIVKRNFERQEFRGARLVVVENGGGAGSCDRHGLIPWRVLTSGRHQSLAKNAGLEFLLSDGWATHWTTFDDDDWYGPAYLQEVADAFAAGHEAVCKSDSFMRLYDGRLVFQTLLGEQTEVPGGHGPTLGSRLWQDMPRFSDADRWGEDRQWCFDLHDLGVKFRATSRFHFCYERSAPATHTFPLTDDQLLAWGFGDKWIAHGNASAIIVGAETPRLEAVQPQVLDLTTHPAFAPRACH